GKPMAEAGPRGGSPLLEDSPDPSSPSTNPQITQISQIGAAGSGRKSASSAKSADASSGVIATSKAPKPLAKYAHARRVGDLLFLAGIGPRVPGYDRIPGGPVRDAKEKPLRYDVKAQTRQCIKNIEAILKESGAGLADVFDVSVFLIDMKNDFPKFNEVYNETFGKFQPARTTVEVEALPGPIAVELKVVANLPRVER
ncbi:MAG TPA: RidA family protein, partial [Candidatus Thermoplasmatota archaeon]|nr:RidA family protein [Candidatus Thermoplasmatota archaeon]